MSLTTGQASSGRVNNRGKAFPFAKPSGNPLRCDLPAAAKSCAGKPSLIIDPKVFGFFTLSQLCKYLDIADRQNVRDVTVRAGAHYIVRGRETWFPVDLWAEWLRSIAVRETPTETSEPLILPLLGADPAATV